MNRRILFGSTSRQKPDQVYVCLDGDSVWIEVNLSSQELSPAVGEQLATLLRGASARAEGWASVRPNDNNEYESLREDLRDIVREEIEEVFSRQLLKLTSK